MKFKFENYKIKILQCDNCGKFDPPILYGNPRLCANCASPNGFYKSKGWELGANGKINWWTLRFPIKIEWRGFWRL